MSAYRFCRTDDIGLLVDALNRCWAPYFPEEPPTTPESFKRSIRDLQVWCSSCMVAFAGSEPIGVLIGAKRRSATLVHRIAIHPDHRREGHARHMLGSLASKLAILGPRRIVAEVPESLEPACSLFRASGFVGKAVLTDFVSDPQPPGGTDDGDRAGFIIPVTVDDLVANGVLEDSRFPSDGGELAAACWERSVETLISRKDEIEGLALASDERIEAYVLYAARGELLALRSSNEHGDGSLRRLLAQLRLRQLPALRLGKVHPAEISGERLEALGFRSVGQHHLFAAMAHTS